MAFLNPKIMTAERFKELSEIYFIVSPSKHPYKLYVVEKAKVGFQRVEDFARFGESEIEGCRLIPQDHSIPSIPIFDPLFIDSLDILHLKDGQVTRSRMR